MRRGAGSFHQICHDEGGASIPVHISLAFAPRYMIELLKSMGVDHTMDVLEVGKTPRREDGRNVRMCDEVEKEFHCSDHTKPSTDFEIKGLLQNKTLLRPRES